MTFFSLQPNGKWSISVLDLVFVFIRLHAIAPTHNIYLLLQYGFKVDTLQHFRIVFYGDFFLVFFSSLFAAAVTSKHTRNNHNKMNKIKTVVSNQNEVNEKYVSMAYTMAVVVVKNSRKKAQQEPSK